MGLRSFDFASLRSGRTATGTTASEEVYECHVVRSRLQLLLLLLGHDQTEYFAERLRSVRVGGGLAHVRDLSISVTNLLGRGNGLCAEQCSMGFAYLDLGVVPCTCLNDVPGLFVDRK